MSYTPDQTVLIGPQQSSVFGDLLTAEVTPILQVDFHYGVNAEEGFTTIGTTGVADTNAARLRLQTGTGAAGFAMYTSDHTAANRIGQGMIVRMGIAFGTPVANCIQMAGIATSTDGFLVYVNGTQFGVTVRSGGVETFVAQSAFNGDKCDGTGMSGFNIDPTKFNSFQIKYAQIAGSFWVLNPATGVYIRMHTFSSVNTLNTVQLLNPDMALHIHTGNTGSTTNTTMYCLGIAVFASGGYSFISNPPWGMDMNKAAITTETNILTIKNCTTYNGGGNHATLRFTTLSFSSTANNGIAILRLKYNSTLGGVPAFTTINGTTADNGVTITAGNSIASYDTAGTTVTGGMYKYGLTIASPGSTPIVIDTLGIEVDPGDSMTFSAFSTASTTIGLAVNWFEDI